MTTSALAVTPLATSFGARIDDAAPADVSAADLDALLAEHLVVFFAPSSLDDEGQQRLLSGLGQPYVHPLAKVMGVTEPSTSRIVDDQDHPPFQNSWHTDVTWDPEAPIIGSLRCVEMPARGGDTLWADMHAAYDALSPVFQQRLASLTAWHDSGTGAAFASKAGAEIYELAKAQYPGVERPIVATHPVNGRRYLNVNSSFTRRIVGMHEAESHGLLQFLFGHIDTPECQYRHRWAVGELAVWDERATQHYAVADHYPQRREMARFVVK